MDKKHISIWIDESDLEECDANIKISHSRSRSDYIPEAVKFYNGYMHSRNDSEFVSKTLMKTMQGMMDSFERRMARQMFKQAVETSKVFWLLLKAFDMEPETVDEFHTDCVEEVKRINGAIQFPMKARDENA